MRLCLLGLVRANVAGRPVALGPRGQRFVAAVLALEVNTLVPVDRLVDLLWPEEPPATARAVVSNHVSGLRAVLRNAGVTDVGVDRGSSGYLLRADPDLIDVHRFRALLVQARQAGGDRQRVALLDEALGLWSGPALAGVTSEDVRVRLCRDLDEARLVATEERVQARLRLGHATHLVDELFAVTEEHPHRPRLVAALMLALHQTGRSPEALEIFDRTTRALRDDLGLGPPTDLRDLQVAILRDDPALAVPPVPAEPTSTPIAVPRQLPADIASFIGRSSELDRIHASHADRDGAVVITAIDGMAGIGKTTLAVHAAHQLAEHYPDGQLFIDLHGHSDGLDPVDPAVAAEALLRSVGVPGGQIPPGLDQRAALLRTRLAGKHMLIVLDNAATESQAAPLLPGEPGCLVLITTRRRMPGLDQATPLTLDVVDLPDGLALFTSALGRTPSCAADLAVIEQIVRLCGRLPLAIRIAAARLRHHPRWTLTHLLDQLRGEHGPLAALHAGQRSVTATVNLSIRDLTDGQQRLLRRLGLQPGPDIDAYAAAALLGASVQDTRVLLEDLLDAHLLTEPQPGRYRFHDLIRHHAATLADHDTDRHAALTRLFDHYAHTATLAMDAAYPHETDQRPHRPAPHTPAPDLTNRAAAQAWLDAELDNLLATATYAATTNWPQHTTHLAATLSHHLNTRARSTEAESLYTHALSAASLTNNRSGELDALHGLGTVHYSRGHLGRASGYYAQELTIARDTGDRTGELNALCGLGSVHYLRGHLERASDHFAPALTIARDIGNRTGEIDALYGLGNVHQRRGHFERASDHFAQALTIARDTGNRTGEINALRGLGCVHYLRGRLEQAGGYYGQALTVARDTGNRTGEIYTLTSLGIIRRLRGRHGQALEHYERAGVIARDTGDLNGQYEAHQGLGRVHQATGHHDQALTHHHTALDLATELGQPQDRALAHDGLAQTHSALGHHELARHHWQAALAVLAAHDIHHTGEPQVTIATVRAHLAEVAQAGHPPAPIPTSAGQEGPADDPTGHNTWPERPVDPDVAGDCIVEV